MSETKNIPISKLVCNTGQIEGLPKNPRFIKDYRFEALKKSIQDAPEMLNLRELLVFPFNDKYVVIGGNMRLKACKELGHKEIPCKILPDDTPAAKLREYTMKDNNAFGETDFDLLNDWDKQELTEWGVELPNWGPENEDINEVPEINEECTIKIICKNLAELADAQKKLNITGKKITFSKLLESI